MLYTYDDDNIIFLEDEDDKNRLSLGKYRDLFIFIRERWEEYLDCRNSYSFGKKDVPLEDIAELIKFSYIAIRETRTLFIEQKKYPDDSSHSRNAYVHMIATISQYCAYDNTADYSVELAFTASCLAAYGLWHYAVFGDLFNFNSIPGVLAVDRTDFWYYDDLPEEKLDRIYNYNVFDADFSELKEMAETM